MAPVDSVESAIGRFLRGDAVSGHSLVVLAYWVSVTGYIGMIGLTWILGRRANDAAVNLAWVILIAGTVSLLLRGTALF